MADDDAQRRGAHQLDRGDIVGAAHGQRLGAGDAGIRRPGGDGDGDDGVLDARPERGDEGERQHQLRKGEEDIGDAHQHRIDPAAGIARRRCRRAGRSGAEMMATSTTTSSVSREP